MAAKSAILGRLAMNLVSVGGIKAVYAPGTASGVQELPDDLVVLPSAVLLPGESPVIPGNWERQTWAVNGTIWTGTKPRGERVQELTDMADDILAAFRIPDVTAVDAAVQSVILREFGPIDQRQWSVHPEAGWFLVLPFSLELKVNRSVTYGPA